MAACVSCGWACRAMRWWLGWLRLGGGSGALVPSMSGSPAGLASRGAILSETLLGKPPRKSHRGVPCNCVYRGDIVSCASDVS